MAEDKSTGSDDLNNTPSPQELCDNPLGNRLFELGSIDTDVEDREDYQPGGYHPVHLGDTFGKNDRYRVIHKLGYGGFATVWLCRDNETEKNVALKIMIADGSFEDCSELLQIRKLKALDFSQTGGDKIVIPQNHFWIDGPNGSHLCLVLPLLGPRVSSIWNRGYDPGNISRNIARQIVQGLAFLHSNGICHGDFRPNNILLKFSNFDDLSEERLIEILGEPVIDPVRTTSGKPPEPAAPEYVVRPIEIDEIDPQYIRDQICIIDFGESYESSSPPENLGIPVGYRAPEVLIEDVFGMAGDVWALACTLYEIRSGIPLFEVMFEKEGEAVAQMVQLFGALPETLRVAWVKRRGRSPEECDSDDIQTDAAPFVEGQTMKEYLREGYRFWDMETGQKTEYIIPGDEIEVLVDLLGQMMKYDLSDRLSVSAVIDHPWFDWESAEDNKDHHIMAECETGQNVGAKSDGVQENLTEGQSAGREGSPGEKVERRQEGAEDTGGHVAQLRRIFVRLIEELVALSG